MISYNSAVELIRQTAIKKPGTTKLVPVLEAIGAVAASQIDSPENVPQFTNSAMDGFAVRWEETAQASCSNQISLNVLSILAAGDHAAWKNANANLAPWSCVEIMTGAPLPESSYDSVIKIEDVEVFRNASGIAEKILISKPAKKAENVRPSGSDFKTGTRVLERGTRIKPEHLLALTSLGITHIPVWQSPKVVVVSTGSELVNYDCQQIAVGFIRNSTGPFLVSALQQRGIAASYYGIVSDCKERYEETIRSIIENGADIIVSTGAVSMGQYDFVRSALETLGASIHFHKTSIRPGKPILFAEIEYSGKDCTFFGVPGNPVSTAVGLRFFIDPYIMTQYNLGTEKSVLAKLNHTFKKPHGLRCFFKGVARISSGGLSVDLLNTQASYIVHSLIEANCWVILPESPQEIDSGELVEILPMTANYGGDSFL